MHLSFAHKSRSSPSSSRSAASRDRPNNHRTTSLGRARHSSGRTSPSLRVSATDDFIMKTFDMPFGAYQNSNYTRPTYLPITPPLDDSFGDDYMSGRNYFLTPQQSTTKTAQFGQHPINPRSPGLLASQAQPWLSVSTNNYSSTSSTSSGSPMSFPAMPVQQDFWSDAGGQSAFPTPASEVTCFDFDASASYGAIETYPHAHDLIDPTSISAPPHAIQNSVPVFQATYGPPIYTHLPSQSSFSYHSNQYHQSRRSSPDQSPSWHRNSPHPSVKSSTSGKQSRQSETTDEETKSSKNRCPYPDCGKLYKDLKAHMLTHQIERPEKCPVASCEFHKRGFARRYDRNRHLVTTHYKSTIVCGFCPLAGTTGETTFNRSDVFKRHLLTKHACEQSSNNRRKSPSTSSGRSSRAGYHGATGVCSTCRKTFTDAQELFNHLDDCFLRVVQDVSPTEVTNERLLSSVAVAEDPVVDRQSSGSSYSNDSPVVGYTTWNNDTTEAANSRKRKNEYPSSWSLPESEVNLKKRVMCVFDGSRRLWKDEMMMNKDFEVRVDLPAGGYVTDLDVETMRRAEFVAGTTDEQRAAWINGVGMAGGYDAERLMT